MKIESIIKFNFEKFDEWLIDCDRNEQGFIPDSEIKRIFEPPLLALRNIIINSKSGG